MDKAISDEVGISTRLFWLFGVSCGIALDYKSWILVGHIRKAAAIDGFGLDMGRLQKRSFRIAV
jgi:hypothetical protein